MFLVSDKMMKNKIKTLREENRRLRIEIENLEKTIEDKNAIIREADNYRDVQNRVIADLKDAKEKYEAEFAKIRTLRKNYENEVKGYINAIRRCTVN